MNPIKEMTDQLIEDLKHAEMTGRLGQIVFPKEDVMTTDMEEGLMLEIETLEETLEETSEKETPEKETPEKEIQGVEETLAK